MLTNEEHDITEDDDNTENELLKSAHFTMEEQIYNRIKSSPQSSHFILQNKESGQACFVVSYHDTTHQQNASKYKKKNKNK